MKKDRCKTGKPCGLACISKLKECKKDLNNGLSQGLGKTAKEVEGVKAPSMKPAAKPAKPKAAPKAATGGKPAAKPAAKKPKAAPKKKEPTEDQLKAKADGHLKKLKRAAVTASEKTYTNNLNKYLEYKQKLRDLGVKVPDKDPPTWDKIAPAAKALKKALKDKATFDKNFANVDPKYTNLFAQTEKARKRHEAAVKSAAKWLRDSYLGKGIGLSPLKNEQDFNNKIKSSNAFYNKLVRESHGFIGKLLKPIVNLTSARHNTRSPEEESAFQKLRDSLLKKLTKEQIKEGFDGIRRFTGLTYSAIRNAQNGRAPNDTYLAMGKAIDRLLNRPEFAKPVLEKFRGISVTTDKLNAMIAGAKINGTYAGVATSSWSTSLATGKKFADKLTGRPEKVIFRTINKLGVPIEGVTSVPNEYEILTPSNANYRYINYRPITIGQGYGATTYHMFDVEEI